MFKSSNKFFLFLKSGIVLSLLVLLFIVSSQDAFALNSPKLATPKADGYVLDQPATFFGYAPKGSIVHFWVDEKYLGGVKVKNPKNKKDPAGSFLYTVSKRFVAGTHTLKVRTSKSAERSDYVSHTFTVPERWYRKLDGKQVKLRDWNKLPFAVMIENTPAARPQAGLSEASVVYETLAEGGVTRFIAIFPQGISTKLIGPIRSGRPYYIDIAAEYNGLFVHAGGSPDAYKEIRKLFVRSYDGLSRTGAKYMYRKCYGVHCMFTDSKKMAKLVKDANVGDKFGKYSGLIFKNSISEKERSKKAQKITVDFNGKTYRVQWQYDRKTNSYKRVLAGIPAKDRNNGKQLSASNVIVQRVSKERVLDYKARIDLKLVGRGKATLFRDGKQIQLTWKKANLQDRTKFYLTNGKEVEFNRGTTWIEILPGNRKVTVQ